MTAITNTIIVPEANHLRFRRVYQPSCGIRKSPDNIGFANAGHPGISDQVYLQKVQKCDLNKIQFLSDFSGHLAELVNCNDDQIKTFPVSLIKQYRNLNFYSEASVRSINGKAFVFFQSGFTYNQFADDQFSDIDKEFSLDGTLPNINVSEGDAVSINITLSTGPQTGFLNTTILNPAFWSVNDQAEGYLLDLDINLTQIAQCQIAITYNAKEQDLYEFEVDVLNESENIYFVRLTAGGGDFTVIYLSEPFDLAEAHTDTTLIQYRHAGIFNESDDFIFEYAENYYSRLRFEGNFYQVTPAGEIENFIDDRGIIKKIRAIPQKNLKIESDAIPGYLVSKFNVIFAHDTLLINEKLWQCEDFGSNDVINLSDFNQFTIELKQVDSPLFNSHTVGADFSAAFDPNSFLDVAFDDLTNKLTDLISDAPGLFELVSKPTWITLNKTQMTAGESLQINFAQNNSQAGSPDRTGTILFRSVTYPALTAGISVSQEAEEASGLWLFSTVTTFAADPNGEIREIIVSSSGSFQAVSSNMAVQVEVLPGTVRLTLAANEGTTILNATITLTLDADNSITDTITVTQNPAGGLINVIPNEVFIGTSGGSAIVEVTRIPGTLLDIQKDSNSDWYGVGPTTIDDGNSPTLELEVFAGATFFGRIGTFTVFNVFNPSNQFTVTVTQS